MEFTPEDLGIRKRCFPKENYIGIYLNHKTIRVPIDKTKPILELEYPEFYDVKITNACTGECTYCYQDSIIEGHYPDVVQKINDFFGPMNMNQRPFQVAIGGGNPNEHPDFIKVLQAFYALGITPNYTTNGIGMADGNIIQATKDLCGGVAITCHRHLDHDWRYATDICMRAGIRTNFHILIETMGDVEYFEEIFKEYHAGIEYFVLLPLLPQGRAAELTDIGDEEKERVLRKSIEIVEGMDAKKQVAFGANYWPYIKSNRNLGLSLYEPEMFSAYIDIKNDIPAVYKSSFSDTVRKIG